MSPVAKPLSPIRCSSKLRARMVNYNDPVTIAKDAGTYAFPSGFRDSQPDLLVRHFDRGYCEALAPHRWCIYVSLHVRTVRLTTQPRPSASNLVGNSSPPFTMSGMSSEGIALTDGRSGFISFFRVRHRLLTQLGTCYRFTPLRA
jgi:hypothetical protein